MNRSFGTDLIPPSLKDKVGIRKPAESRSYSIRVGLTEGDSYNRLVRRLRHQFLSPSSSYQPVVLPPILPSTLRPKQPRARSISELLQASRQAAALRCQSESQLPLASPQGSSYSSSPPSPQESKTPFGVGPLSTIEDIIKVNSHNSDRVTNASLLTSTIHSSRTLQSCGESVDPELPLHNSNSSSGEGDSNGSIGSHAHYRIIHVNNNNTKYRKNIESISRERSSPNRKKSEIVSVQCLIGDLEAVVRGHILRAEVSERHAVFEMMALDYVNFVLKPEMDNLIEIEWNSRKGILFKEKRAWDLLLHQTPLVRAIREEIRANVTRAQKMARLAVLHSEQGTRPSHHNNVISNGSMMNGVNTIIVRDPHDYRGRNDVSLRGEKEGAAASPVAAASDTRRVVQRYLDVKRVSISEKGRGLSASPHSLDLSFINLAAFSPRVGGRGSLSPAVLSGGSGGGSFQQFQDTFRRASDLLGPSVSYSKRGYAGRKTIGIAELAPLIDKITSDRRALIWTEQEERQNLMERFRLGVEAVVRWEHKRRHLERLFFWRDQRDRALVEDLRNTVKGVVNQLCLRRIDPGVELQLLRCERLESKTRNDVLLKEKDAFRLLSSHHHALYQSYYQKELEKAYQQVWEETHREALVGLVGLLIESEGNHRVGLELGYSKWIRSVVEPRLEMLEFFFKVSRNSSKHHALVVLQRAFRRSLRGQLHWRFANREIGWEIRQRRDKKRIAHGQEALRAFREKLNLERILVEKEIAKEYARLQSALQLKEQQCRASLIIQEGAKFVLLEWEFSERFRK